MHSATEREVRPSPFDGCTENVYADAYWETRTGVGQLAQALFLKEQDSIAMLAFYGDGSGEHGKGMFVVAGYLADTRDWFDVERAWSAELERTPRIAYFKGGQCQHLDGEFAGFSREQADEKRLRLAEVVRRHSGRMMELSSTIAWDAYRSVIGDGIVAETYYHPYFFCFRGLASLTIERATEGGFRDHPGRVAFVFDTESQRSLDEDVQAQYNHARRSLPAHIAARMGSTTWDDDINFPMLQVADMIAWSVRRGYAGLDSPLLTVLRDDGKISGSFERKWNTERLRQWVVDTEARAKAL